MIRYHRSTYEYNGVLHRTSWWQFGDRIFFHRTRI